LSKGKYQLSLNQIAKVLEIGIRLIQHMAPKKDIKGDMLAAFYLVPTFQGEWIRQHAKEIKSSWDGSYIPLIIYKNKTAVILVSHNEVYQWKVLTSKLSEALKMPVSTRGD